VLLTLGIIGVLQFAGEVPQQARNLRTYIAVAAGTVALLGWLLGYSRLRWRTRLGALAGIALLGTLASMTLRIGGVDGNLVPILEWRRSTPTPPTAAIAPMPDGGLVQTDRAGDWPQFLGPTRDCQAPALHLEADWRSHPPVELWRIPVGAAWAGFAVVQGRAITLEQQGDQEVAVCRDATTGRTLWAEAWEARYSTTIGGTGPRSVPAIVHDRVLVTGATGWLRCLRVDDGELLWARNVLEDNHAGVPTWGYSASPLVVDERVIVSVGGGSGRSLMAYALADGSPLWQGGDGSLSYSSPVVAELGGKPQIVVLNAKNVAGHDPKTGRVLWEAPFPARDVVVAAPLRLDQERVLFSAGYGYGSEVFRVRPAAEEGVWTVEQEWTSRRMKAKFANLALHEGDVYGLDDGILACISAVTGELKWKDGRYGHGQMILTGNLLLLMAEDGRVVLIAANPKRLHELGRVRLFSEKTWNPPAFSGDRLFVRNDREAVCLKLPLTAD
jgi:outer membrane protein assembly factor BamB